MHKIMVAAAAAVVLMASGCSSTTDSGSGAPSAGPSVDPSPSAPSGEAPVDGEDGVALANTDYAPPDTPRTVSPGVGQTYAGATMTVTGIECGLARVPRATGNPDWNGNADEAPKYLDAVAGDGFQFCRVEAKYAVTGTSPKEMGWDDFADLIAVDGKRYVSDDVATDVTYNVNDDASGCPPAKWNDCALNPGTETTVFKFFHLPTGVQPRYVTWPDLVDEVPGVVYAFEVVPA